MSQSGPFLIKRITGVSILLAVLLGLTMLAGICTGSSENPLMSVLASLTGGKGLDPTIDAIVWRIRLPRVILAALVGAALSVGGLVFQALLRNPLAEPYILGVSGGSAVGAIIGIMLGFSVFPGVSFTAFAGSMSVLALVFVISPGQAILKKDSLLLAGVMINAFCSALIMFFISLTNDSKLHSIIFWLMGDFSMADIGQDLILGISILPCLVLIFLYSHAMNLFLMGRDLAHTLGVNIKVLTIVLLVATSFMVSATVSHCGLVGFVGLVIPHMFRLALGPDHRVLFPACLLGGGAYMVFCDVLARTIPNQGEMPVGVITAIIGAPLFIYLLKRSRR